MSQVFAKRIGKPEIDKFLGRCFKRPLSREYDTRRFGDRFRGPAETGFSANRFDSFEDTPQIPAP